MCRLSGGRERETESERVHLLDAFDFLFTARYHDVLSTVCILLSPVYF